MASATMDAESWRWLVRGIGGRRAIRGHRLVRLWRALRRTGVDEGRWQRLCQPQLQHKSGARSNLMEDHVQADIIADRYDRFMRKAQEISALKLKEKISKTYTCVIDAVGPDQLLCRTMFDAPEIDGIVYVPNHLHNHCVGDRLKVKINASSEYDLTGELV